MTTRRVTANLPKDLLRIAQEVTGKGITENIVEGLELVRRRRAGQMLKALKGRMTLDIDLDSSRERRR